MRKMTAKDDFNLKLAAFRKIMKALDQKTFDTDELFYRSIIYREAPVNLHYVVYSVISKVNDKNRHMPYVLEEFGHKDSLFYYSDFCFEMLAINPVYQVLTKPEFDELTRDEFFELLEEYNEKLEKWVV